ncbi:MAG: hypothetical protein K2G32_04550 [Oscillospiraceae bacterium]|nr:hypothetical protein [Oscillospiraceae bacterium]
MKKLFVISSLVILLAGCAVRSSPQTEDADEPSQSASKPKYIVLHQDPPDVCDGMTTLLYYDREVILLKFGEQYGESLYLAAYNDINGGKFESRYWESFVIPEEYAPRLGEAIKLTADIQVTQGGIIGQTVNYIKAEDVKECRTLDITDDELRSAVPLWEEALEEAWLPVSGFSGGVINGLNVFRYTEDGEIYIISPDFNADKESCTLFKDGQPVGTYGGAYGALDNNGGSYIVLCDEDFDVSLLDKPYTERSEDFYLLGTVSPRIDIGSVYCDSARMKEGAELDEEKFVIYSEEDKARYGDLFDDLYIVYDAAVFGIKCEKQLEVKDISVDIETNRICMVLEETERQSGGYSIIGISPDALGCVDISDFGYTIENKF